MMKSTTSLLVSTSHTRLNLNLGVPIFQVAMRNGEQKTGWIKHRKEKGNYGLSCAHMLVVQIWFIVPLRFSLISLSCFRGVSAPCEWRFIFAVDKQTGDEIYNPYSQ